MSFADQRWLRTINTTVAGGDGLGTADVTGVFGKGGPNADGIAVFSGLSGAITSTTIPLDSVFFGTAVGTARPATGGFKAAQNDRYTSAGVFGDAGNSFLFPDGATPAGWLARYHLDGYETAWRAAGGEMELIARVEPLFVPAGVRMLELDSAQARSRS